MWFVVFFVLMKNNVYRLLIVMSASSASKVVD
jgi:hypothetical protein